MSLRKIFALRAEKDKLHEFVSDPDVQAIAHDSNFVSELVIGATERRNEIEHLCRLQSNWSESV